MWSPRRISVRKVVAVLLLYCVLAVLRKRFVSVDLRLLQWYYGEMKFPDRRGVSTSFLNLGEISYNLTDIHLTTIDTEYSEITTTSLFRHHSTNAASYLNFSLHNIDAKFKAKWSYAVLWPSLEDAGNLSVEIRAPLLEFAAKLETDVEGLVNVTVAHCALNVGNVKVQLKFEPSLLYETIASNWENQVKEKLPNGLCKALENSTANNLTSVIQRSQLAIVSLLFFTADPHAYSSNVLNNFSLVIIKVGPILLKVFHDYGVTLVLLFSLASVYLVYEVSKSAQLFSTLKAKFFARKSKRKHSDGDVGDIWVTAGPSATTIDMSDTVTQASNGLMVKFRKLFWWKKSKEN